MSLQVDGVWKAGVWAATVWADGVWFEGAQPAPAAPRSPGIVRGSDASGSRTASDSGRSTTASDTRVGRITKSDGPT